MVQAINNSKTAQEAILAPISDWSEMSDTEHFVQFYETDAFLLNSLGGYVGTALKAGEAAIVVATKEHRESLEARLLKDGLDVASAIACCQFVLLDAAETLSKFMVDEAPAPERFFAVMEGIIPQAAGDRQRVRIFGEMVALLWAEGNQDGALRLEELWNELLHKIDSFSLFCAYPMNGFGGEELVGQLGNVCSGHSRVIPAESYTALPDADERLRAITLLQQKANSLQAEIEERKEAEHSLRAVKDELETQVEDLRRLHEMSVSLTSTLDLGAVLHEVLRATLAVQHTDLGMLSLADEARGGLNLKAQSGFEAVFKQVEWVPSGAGACGECLRQGQRVMVEDVEVDPAFGLDRLHGGTVSADSPGEGRGATFTISLPLAPAQQSAKDRRREIEARWLNEESLVAKPLLSLDGGQVLLVADDRDTLRMLTAMLTEYKANVHPASSAADALEALQWYKPDVLVSDLAMPDEDGYSLIGKVRALAAERGRQIPTVALTACVRVEDRVRALAAGFTMFVPKPVEPQELIAAIANLVASGTTRFRL